MSNLAIALQVWNGDVWEGIKLMKLICSIEKEKRSDIEVIISTKRDTNPPAAQELVAAAKQKFTTVHHVQGKRFGGSWPDGPNQQWAETMMRVGQLYSDQKIKSTGVLTFEADCIPLRPDWLNVLAEEWAKGEQNGKLVVGHAHRFGDQTEPNHINGNAIFDTQIIKRFPQLIGSDSLTGWDVYHAKLLLSIGQDTDYIHQLYRIPKMSKKEVAALRKNGKVPALFHGLKSGGPEVIQEMMNDGSYYEL